MATPFLVGRGCSLLNEDAPYLEFEGASGKPAIAMEVWDMYPQDWPDTLKESLGEVVQDPARWAKACCEMGADLVCLRLAGCHPDRANRSPAQASETVKQVLKAVPVPLIVWGSGNAEKDNEIFPAVAEAAAGENCLIGTITEGNYKTLTAVCTAYKHKLIAESPCDVNIAKHVNILAQDMGFSVENIVIYPKNTIISKVFQSQINKETFQYLHILVRRNRINLLQSIIESYLELVYRLASVKMVEVSTAFPFTNRQKNTLIKKLAKEEERPYSRQIVYMTNYYLKNNKLRGLKR